MKVNKEMELRRSSPPGGRILVATTEMGVEKSACGRQDDILRAEFFENKSSLNEAHRLEVVEESTNHVTSATAREGVLTQNAVSP